MATSVVTNAILVLIVIRQVSLQRVEKKQSNSIGSDPECQGAEQWRGLTCRRLQKRWRGPLGPPTSRSAYCRRPSRPAGSTPMHGYAHTADRKVARDKY